MTVYGQNDPGYILIATEHPDNIEEMNSDYLDYRPGKKGVELFLWDGTCEGETLEGVENVYEGNSAIRVLGKAGWFGFGFASLESLDVSMFSRENYTLHFAIRSESSSGFFIQMDYSTGIPNSAVVNLSDRYAFARDGEWHRIEIPMSAFLSQGIEWNGRLPEKNNIFSIVAPVSNGDEVVDLDYIYFYKDEPETKETKSPAGDYPDYVLVATEHTGIEGNANYLDLRPNNITSNMYVWENTATGIDPVGEAFEGDTYTNLRIDANWFGIGFASSVPENFSTFAHKEFILHFAVKTTSDMPLYVKLEGATGAGSYYLDFPRDGQWHLIEIPMEALYRQGLVWDKNIANINYFSLISEDCRPGDEIAFDHVMFYSGKRDYDNGGGFEKPTTPSYILVAAEHTGIENNPDFLDIRPYGDIRHMYIWENTAIGNENPPAGGEFEGATYTEITTVGNGWFGLGFVSDEYVDFNAFAYSTYDLYFAIKTTSDVPLFVKLEGVQGEASVYLKGKYEFPRDGQWHEIRIPVEEFFSQGMGWAGPVSGKNYFSLVSENNPTPATIGFDAVWFEKTGDYPPTNIETVPVTKEQLSVSQNGGMLSVHNIAENTGIEIISLKGITVKKTTETQIYVGDLSKGLYIIKAGDKVTKVIVN